MKKIMILIVSVVFQLTGFVVYAQNEADFYTEPGSFEVTKNVVNDFGANGSDMNDDSDNLQNAIDAVTALDNGGKIIVPAGTYYLVDVEMRSNVHIEIDSEATIKMAPVSDTKNHAIFVFDKKNEIVRNVSISATGGRFKVDFTNLTNKNIAVVRFNNVENFLVSDFVVMDDITKFSAVTFGYADLDGGYNMPENGVVKNIKAYNQHYGYGVVQAQAAKNVLFKNLWGQGGVTLRFETGYDKMNKLQAGGLFNCYGRDIYCENGNAAYMMSPHAIQNGYVDIDGVTAVNCGMGVRIGNGYVKPSLMSLGIEPGTFASTSVIKNVTATYGSSAQVKSKHFKYMPCELRNQISDGYNPDGESYSAPSIAAVLNAADGTGPGFFNVTITNVKAYGFEYQPKAIVTDEDAQVDCETSSVADKGYSKGIKVFPNPFDDRLTVRVENGADFNLLQLIDTQGGVRFSKLLGLDSQSIDLCMGKGSLPKGMYFVKMSGKDCVGLKKVFKR